MEPTRLGSLVWPGMILAGLLLAVAVWVAWPEPSTRLVRFPSGESQPEAPDATRSTRQVSVAPPVEQPRAPAAIAQPEETAAEPARALAGAAAPATEEIDLDDGPAPVPAETEVDGYVPESPEELGARPLPGTDATPAPPLAG